MNTGHVLYVEDALNDRMLLAEAFRAAGTGLTLHAVEDGETALAYLSGRGHYGDRQAFPLPAVVLLDLKLPLLSGLEVLKWIRHQPALQPLRVILLTASVQHGDIQAAYAAGADGFLTKPTQFARLREIVQVLAQCLGAEGGHWDALKELPEYHGPGCY